MNSETVLLGIESSCDDTSAAVMVGAALRSNVVSSQLDHSAFGGVVPELASRAHQRMIVPVIEQALSEAAVGREDLDAVAVTYGPGLAGSLLVGISFGKALALALGIPLVGVNHLDGHIYSVFIEEPFPPFPFLSLIVSGGHTQIVLVEEGLRHTILGRTRDDAAGEAFDKVAKLLGLGYPGGPIIDRLAREGNPAFQSFPRSRPGGLDFSFSGLKTSVLYYLNGFQEAERQALYADHLADLCASFQQAVVDVLAEGVSRAVNETGIRHVAMAGGVSANTQLRETMHARARKEGFMLYTVPTRYCMDNAAMIAAAGRYKLRAGQTSPLTLTAVP